MRSSFRLIALWLLAAVVFSVLQFAYQVNELAAFVAAGLLLAFSVLLSWSANRVNVKTPAGFAKLLAMSLVVGLMTAQGLDVLYSAGSLPAGGRLDLAFEVVYFAVLVFPVAYFGGRFWPRPQPEEYADPGEGQGQPN